MCAGFQEPAKCVQVSKSPRVRRVPSYILSIEFMHSEDRINREQVDSARDSASSNKRAPSPTVMQSIFFKKRHGSNDATTKWYITI